MCARISPTTEIAWKRLWCTQLFKGRMRAEEKQKAASAKAAAKAAAEQTLHCSRTTDLEASNDLGQQALITLNTSSSSGDHRPNSIMVPPAGQEMAPLPEEYNVSFGQSDANLIPYQYEYCCNSTPSHFKLTRKTCAGKHNAAVSAKVYQIPIVRIK